MGKEVNDLLVRPPEDLPKLVNSNSRIIITSVHYTEIAKQLEDMGISYYYIFIDGYPYKRDNYDK